MNVMKRILAITLTVMSISSYAGGRGCARCHGGACSRKSAPAARQSCPNGVCHRQPAPQAQSGCSNGGGFRAMYFAAKKAEAEAKQKAAQAKRQQERENAELARGIANSLKDTPVAPAAIPARTVVIDKGASTSAQPGSGSEAKTPDLITPAPQAQDQAVAPTTVVSQEAPADASAAPASKKQANILITLPLIEDDVVQTLNADAKEASKILNFFTNDQDKLVLVKWINKAKGTDDQLRALINTLMEGNKEGFKAAVRNIMALQQDAAIAEDQLIDYVFELIQSNTNNQAICNLITVVYNMDHNFPTNQKGVVARIFGPSLSGILTNLGKLLDIDGTDITEEQKTAWQQLSPLHKLYYIELLAAYCAVMNQLSKPTTTK